MPPHRFDLDGRRQVNRRWHRQAAAAELRARRRSLFEARRAAERAAANEARRHAEAAARQQHAAEEARGAKGRRCCAPTSRAR